MFYIIRFFKKKDVASFILALSVLVLAAILMVFCRLKAAIPMYNTILQRLIKHYHNSIRIIPPHLLSCYHSVIIPCAATSSPPRRYI